MEICTRSRHLGTCGSSESKLQEGGMSESVKIQYTFQGSENASWDRQELSLVNEGIQAHRDREAKKFWTAQELYIFNIIPNY